MVPIPSCIKNPREYPVLWGFFLLLAACYLVMFMIVPLNSPTPQKDEPPLRIGFSCEDNPVLLLVADDHQIFREYELDIRMQEYSSSRAVMEAFRKGEADIIYTNDILAMQAIRDDANLTIIGSTSRRNDTMLYTRAGVDVNTPQGYNITIGIPPSLSTFYFIGQYLQAFEIADEEISHITGETREEGDCCQCSRERPELPMIRVAEPAVLLDGFCNGTFDAIAGSGLSLDMLCSPVSGTVNSTPLQGGERYYTLLAVQTNLVDQYPDQTERFIRSLAAARDIVRHDPSGAEDLLRSRSEHSEGCPLGNVSRDDTRLSLDQSLITMMEKKADWMDARDRDGNYTIPNILNVINWTPLETVDPYAVSIIR
ncbi:MAG TPA: hypothetical protein VN372_07280 [Methanospirillum sp.]|nr:hypothetical protein [Methanospirillum sp.]